MRNGFSTITIYERDYINNKKRFLKFSKVADANFITTDPRSLNFKVKNSFFIPNPADKSFEILENYKNDCKMTFSTLLVMVFIEEC